MIDRALVASSEPDRIYRDLKEEWPKVTEYSEYDAIDYDITGGGRLLLVERKSVDDLEGAFLKANEASGEPRIIAQLRHMSKQSGPNTLVVLLIEGHMRNQGGFLNTGRHRTRIPYNAIDNFLMLVQHWGIRIAHSSSDAHTAARLISIAENWFSDEEKGPIIMLPPGPTPQMRLLRTLPGIGATMSKHLAGKYENLGQLILAAMAGDLVDVPRLGPNARAKIQAFFEKPL